MLDRTHKKFKSDAYRVSEAIKGLIKARKDLLLALATDGPDKDKTIAGMQVHRTCMG